MGRIEVGVGILDKIIYEFYDSSYIDQDNYLEILEELSNVFYLYQTEMSHCLTDEQIIKYLRRKFDDECKGSTELLESLSFENLKEELKNGEFYV